MLDVILIGLLVVAGLSGYRRGLTLQALSFGGLLIGLAIGALIAPTAARLVESAVARAGVVAIVLVTFATIGDVAGWLLGSRLRTHARASRFGAADAAGGSAVAVLASLLAIWFVALNLANGPFPTVAAEVRGSAIVRTLDGALPAPPSLLAQVRGLFNRFGIPDVFSGIPPLPADPVQPPTRSQARSAFSAAAASTVRVAGQACDHIQEGSGFVVADGYVVTNAHVVAGVDAPQVQATDGPSEGARTVLFDPDVDVAVLYVDVPPGPALVFEPNSVDRGTAGAVVGYPGGGPLSGEPAAVRRTIEAVGRDIYGRRDVVRQVLELQARVRPGNSGGPFVLPDGGVGGIVFATSTADPGIGYAIAPTEVFSDLDRAFGSTAAVGTGPCIR